MELELCTTRMIWRSAQGPRLGNLPQMSPKLERKYHNESYISSVQRTTPCSPTFKTSKLFGFILRHVFHRKTRWTDVPIKRTVCGLDATWYELCSSSSMIILYYIVINIVLFPSMYINRAPLNIELINTFRIAQHNSHTYCWWMKSC